MSPKTVLDQEDFAKAECPSYLIKLDLGCGDRCKEGFKGVDISPDVKPDFVHDLNVYPYPFGDSSVFEIFCSHFIEHVGNLKRFMEEVWRMLVPLGLVTFVAPYYSSIRAWQDYTHVRPVSEHTFLYFNKEWMDANKLQHYGVRCDFDILRTKYIYAPDWEVRADQAREWAREHYINVVQDIEVQLRVRK